MGIHRGPALFYLDLLSVFHGTKTKNNQSRISLKGLCLMSLKFYVATERLKQTQIAHVAGDLGKGSPRFSTAS